MVDWVTVLFGVEPGVAIGLGLPDLEFDLDVLAAHPDLIVGDVSRCRCTKYGAARDVENRTVPGAGHFCASNQSLRERPALMGAGIVNRIELSVDVEECYSLPAGVHCPRLTRRDLGCCGNLDEFWKGAVNERYTS
jgi:hypothetical protein